MANLFFNFLIFSCLGSLLALGNPTATGLKKSVFELKNKFSNGIINFNSTGYNNFVIKSPRPYHIFVLFTGSEDACEGCRPSTDAFIEIAHNYHSFYEQKISESSDYPIIFSMIFVDKVDNLAAKHGLNSLPAIVYIPPERIFSAKQMLIERSAQWRILEQRDVSARNILIFVNSKTKESMELFIPFSSKVQTLLIALVALLVICITIWGLVFYIRKNPFIIVLLSIIPCILCMSGLVYSIQHKSSLYGNQNGQIEYVTKNARTQYLGEGIFMAIAMTLTPTILMIYINLPNKRSRIASYLQGPVIPVIFAILLFGIMVIYNRKLPWYNPTFFPPNDYIKGPIKLDRGNSI